jgi:hypothetical protein
MLDQLATVFIIHGYLHLVRIDQETSNSKLSTILLHSLLMWQPNLIQKFEELDLFGRIVAVVRFVPKDGTMILE